MSIRRAPRCPGLPPTPGRLHAVLSTGVAHRAAIGSVPADPPEEPAAADPGNDAAQITQAFATGLVDGAYTGKEYANLINFYIKKYHDLLAKLKDCNQLTEQSKKDQVATINRINWAVRAFGVNGLFGWAIQLLGPDQAFEFGSVDFNASAAAATPLKFMAGGDSKVPRSPFAPADVAAWWHRKSPFEAATEKSPFEAATAFQAQMVTSLQSGSQIDVGELFDLLATYEDKHNELMKELEDCLRERGARIAEEKNKAWQSVRWSIAALGALTSVLYLLSSRLAQEKATLKWEDEMKERLEQKAAASLRAVHAMPWMSQHIRVWE